MKKRLLTGVLGAALLVPALTACGGGDAQAFCDIGAESDPGEFMDDPAAMEDAMQEMRDNAPDEISDDVNTVLDAFDEMQEDPSAMESMDLEEMEAASDRVDTWIQENCEAEDS